MTRARALKVARNPRWYFRSWCSRRHVSTPRSAWRMYVYSRRCRDGRRHAALVAIEDAIPFYRGTHHPGVDARRRGR